MNSLEVKNEYLAIAFVNQILGVSMPHLHLYLTSFTPHLFNKPFLQLILPIQFHANQQDQKERRRKKVFVEVNNSIIVIGMKKSTA